MNVKDIVKVEVLLTNASDLICLTLDLEGPFPADELKHINPVFKLDVAHNHGVEYCEKVLGLRIDRVINTRSGLM